MNSFSPDRVNPEEIGGDMEGDILLTDLQKTGKSGMILASLRWPNARIPYTINTAHYCKYLNFDGLKLY